MKRKEYRIYYKSKKPTQMILNRIIETNLKKDISNEIDYIISLQQLKDFITYLNIEYEPTKNKKPTFSDLEYSIKKFRTFKFRIIVIHHLTTCALLDCSNSNPIYLLVKIESATNELKNWELQFRKKSNKWVKGE